MPEAILQEVKENASKDVAKELHILGAIRPYVEEVNGRLDLADKVDVIFLRNFGYIVQDIAGKLMEELGYEEEKAIELAIEEVKQRIIAYRELLAGVELPRESKGPGESEESRLPEPGAQGGQQPEPEPEPQSQPQPPAAPAWVTGIVNGDDVRIYWAEIKGEEIRYQVQIYREGRLYRTFITSTNQRSLYNLPQGNYSIKVRAINSAGKSRNYAQTNFRIRKKSQGQSLTAEEPERPEGGDRPRNPVSSPPPAPPPARNHLPDVRFAGSPAYFSTGVSIYWYLVSGARRYYYQIVNSHGKIVKTGSSSSRSLWIAFNGLTPGNYRLKVKAIAQGKASRNYSSISFYVRNTQTGPRFTSRTNSRGDTSAGNSSNRRRRESSHMSRRSNPEKRSDHTYTPPYRRSLRRKYSHRSYRRPLFNLPLLNNSSSILAPFLPDLSGLLRSGYSRSDLTRPYYHNDYRLYLDTVNYWRGVENRLSWIMGRRRASWTRRQMISTLTSRLGNPAYLYHLGSSI